MHLVWEPYGLTNLMNELTFLMNPENSTFVDLMLTNSRTRFQYFCTIETSLPSFHKVAVTKLRATFQNEAAKMNLYSIYKNLSNDEMNKKFYLDYRG